MNPTTISVSPENRHYLTEYKRKAGLRSIDAAIEQLFCSGQHMVERIWPDVEEDVRAVCRAFGVRRLVAFGSRVWGAPHANSDLDLAYEAEQPFRLRGLSEFEDRLSAAFGLDVDLVSLHGTATRLRRRIHDEGVELLA